MDLFKLCGTIAIDNNSANRAIDETTNKAEGAGGRIPGAFKKVGCAVATFFAADKIVQFGKNVVDTTASFEDSMLKTQSLMGASDSDYKKLKASALEWGSKTAWSAKDVADAMGYMALAGWNTNETLNATGGMLNLASASGEDLATVTDILTDATTGFGDSAKDANRYADVLATTQAKSNTTVGLLGESFKYVSSLAGSYGYKLEDVSTALGIMANAGVKGSMSGTALSSIITRLGNNTSGARDAVEKLGVQFYNQDGTARNLSDVLKDMCDATKGMTVEQKANFAQTVAGQDAQKGLLAILNQGSGAYSKLEKEIKNCSGTSARMAKNMESGVGGGIRNLQSALEGFKIALGEKFSKPLGDTLKKVASFITNSVVPNMGKMVSAASKIGNVLKYIIPLFATFKAGMAIGNAVVTFQKAQVALALFSAQAEGASIAQAALNGTLTLGETITGIMTGQISLASLAQEKLNIAMAANPIGLVITLIGALVIAFIALWNNCKPFREFWLSLWKDVKKALEPVISKLKTGFSEAWKVIKQVWGVASSFFKGVWEAIKVIFTPVAKVLGEGFKHAWEVIKATWGVATAYFKAIFETIKGVFTVVKDVLSGDFSGAWEAIKGIVGAWGDYFKAIWEQIKVVFSPVTNFFSSVFGGAISAVSGVFSGLVSTVQSVFEIIKNVIQVAIMFIGNIIKLAFNIITLPWQFIWQNCKGVIIPIFDSIKAVIQNVLSNIGSFISAILNTIHNTFSTVFNAIKTVVTTVFNAISSVVSPIWNGIKNTISNVIHSIASVISSVWNGIKGTITSILNGIKSVFSSIWNGIKSVVTGAINGVKGVVSSGMNAVKSVIGGPLNAIKSKFSSIFNEVKSIVTGAINNVKSVMHFSWSLPHLKLPHFSIKGGFKLDPPSVPSFGISWYKKAYENAVEFAHPTVLGTAGGLKGFGDGTGSEMVVGKANLFNMIKEASGSNQDAVADKLDTLINMLSTYLPVLMQQKQIVLDSGALVGQTVPLIDKELGLIAKRKGRS